MAVVAEPECMGRKRKPAEDASTSPPAVDREKYRKFHKAVRIRGQFVVIAEQATAELGHDLTQWVNDAVRMRLASEGRWPPPPDPAPKPAARRG